MKLFKSQTLGKRIVAFSIAALLMIPATFASGIKANAEESHDLSENEAEYMEVDGTFSTEGNSYIGMIIHDNISINGFDVGGMSYMEAMSLMESVTGKNADAKVTLQGEAGTVKTKLSSIGYKLNYSKSVKEAMSVGNTGNVLKRYKEDSYLNSGEFMNFELTGEISKSLLVSVIDKELGDEVKGTSDITLKKLEDGKVQLVMGDAQVAVNYDATYTKLVDYMKNEWTGKGISSELVVDESGMSEMQKQLSQVTDLLGEYSTNYSSAKGRMKNIERATTLINGKILMPGEQISVHKSLEPVTEANGYALAGQYVGGKLVDGVGGGICQVATTLYNAVIRAELEIVQRSNHGMSVSYVPLSADAALAGNTLDLKFKNNTDAPIYIEGIYGGGYVTYRIYGKEYRPSNRTIEFVSKTIETIDPPEEVVTEDPELAPGKRKVTQKAHTGYVAELWKNVYIDGKLTDSIQINTSKYKATPTYVSVGPQLESEASTEVPTEATTEPTTKPTEATTKPTTTETTEKPTEATTSAPDPDPSPSPEPQALPKRSGLFR